MRPLLFSRSNLLWFLLAILGIGSPYLIEAVGWDRPDPKDEVEVFERKLQKRIGELEQELSRLQEKARKEGVETLFRSEWSGDEDEPLLFLYQGDSLRYWSGNWAPIPGTPEAIDPDAAIVRLENGFYYQSRIEEGGRIFLGLSLIKKEHPYENRYLKNRFFTGSGLPPSADVLSNTDKKGVHMVEGPEGGDLFGVRYPEERKLSTWAYWSSVLLNIIGILSFLLFLARIEARVSKKVMSPFSLIGLVALLLLLRQFTLMNHFPGIWHRTELFSPTLYAASDQFPTLGDLLINAVLFLYIAFLTHRRALSSALPERGIVGSLLPFLFSLLLMSIGLWSGELTRGLVENSNIFFDLNHPFDLSIHSLIGLIAVACLLFAFFLFTDALLSLTRGEKRSVANVLGAGILGTLLFSFPFGIVGIRVLFPLTVLALVAWVHYQRGRTYAFPQVVLLLTVFALFTASIVARYSDRKEKQNREVLAEQLADDEDPVTDLQFSGLEDRLKGDTLLRAALDKPPDPMEMRKHLERDHFRGYWSEYRINAHLFGEEDSLLFRMNERTVRRKKSLEALIQEEGSPTDLSDNLYYIHRSPDLVNYVAKVPIGGGVFFVELLSRQVPREVGFPELLLEERSELMGELGDHSYARFLDDRLVDRSGPYSYRRRLSAYEGLDEDQEWLVRKGYEHFFYRTGEGNAIVLSRPEKGWLSIATTFSYLFILFSVLLLLFVALKDLSMGKPEWQFSLKGKVRVLMVGITLASVLILALVTRVYVRDQYRFKNEGQIREKARSVLLELGERIGGWDSLSSGDRDRTEHALSELSNVLFTDINLYGPGGRLFATSREKVFEEGLLGDRVHPEAYRSLLLDKKSEFVHTERIGSLEYLSGYAPLSNDKGEVLGYVNLPYFAKQNELEQELSTFFVAILNVFVLLFALSLVSALFISTWVTRPLRRLQESLSRIELQGSNEALMYRGRDEIGELVSEYNRKVAELEEKAEALARSERESAWREMAKQVAHEIKNPLTPMRLQLQQLKRSGGGKDPEKMEATVDRLIERIDALSRIASEFSHFAEMPQAREELIDLAASLQGTIELYSDSPGLNIDLKREPEVTPQVRADPDQIARVLANLLSNAIEAIPEEREGRIEVSLMEDGDEWIVGVQDNGKGIPQEDLERIFEPNFTTRSRGTGLGLAIAKSLVEMNGGRIDVSSKEGKGSLFRIRLPKAGAEDGEA